MNPLLLTWYLPIPFPGCLRRQGHQAEVARGPYVCVGVQLPAKWHRYPPAVGPPLSLGGRVSRLVAVTLLLSTLSLQVETEIQITTEWSAAATCGQLEA